MNCTDARRLMQAFVDGELSESASHQLLAHARECHSCRLALEHRQDLVKAASGALETQARAPAGLAAAVSARIAHEPARSRGILRRIAAAPARVRRVGVAAAAAAAVVLLAAALLGPWNPRSAPSTPEAGQPASEVAHQPPAGSPEGSPQLAEGAQAEGAERPATEVRPAITVPQPAAETRPAQALFAVIAARQPAADATGRALQVGGKLPAGATIRTGTGGRVTLITRRGSEFTLSADTELAVSEDARSASLRSGRIYCRSRLGEFAAVATPAGRIQLLGTTIDAAIEKKDTVAVTVVEGEVRLANAHGEALVSAGKKAMLVAQLPPDDGTAVDVAAQTAWYDGRRLMSDYGEIAYAVSRGDKNITEVWVMNADASGKHRVKSYIGSASSPGPWLPGEQVLLVQPAGLIWAYPDFDQQRADTHSGAAMIQPWITWWLLDAATGQDVSITVPPEYDAFHMALSPDATMIAFGGTRRSDPADPKSWESGTWLYDLHTDVITRLLDGRAESPPAWSPDGRLLAVGVGTPWPARRDLRLVIANTMTGEIIDPAIAGTDPCFSPDGTKIAYVGDIAAQRTSRDQGKIFVLDLPLGSQPQQISPGPEGAGSSEPRWSPDGTRVAYWVLHLEEVGSHERSLRIALADGSSTWEVYRGTAWPAAWNRTGDALYVTDRDQGLLLVAADGSGIIAELGGTELDSPLSAPEETSFAAAQTAVRQAVFQHAMGKRSAYYGKAAEAKAAHRKSAQLFAEMPWRCPYLGLSLTNTLVYADAEEAMADQPASQILLDTCKQRLSHAAYLVAAYYRRNGEYAPDLATLEMWAKTLPLTTMNDVIRLDRDDVSVIFRCPEGDLFTYTPPAAGAQPKEGDVMLTCPNHRDHKATWRKSGDGWGADTPSGWRITNAW